MSGFSPQFTPNSPGIVAASPTGGRAHARGEEGRGSTTARHNSAALFPRVSRRITQNTNHIMSRDNTGLEWGGGRRWWSCRGRGGRGRARAGYLTAAGTFGRRRRAASGPEGAEARPGRRGEGGERMLRTALESIGCRHLRCGDPRLWAECGRFSRRAVGVVGARRGSGLGWQGSDAARRRRRRRRRGLAAADDDGGRGTLVKGHCRARAGRRCSEGAPAGADGAV